MRGLYAIVDAATLEKAQIKPLLFASALVSVKPAALQLRAKALPPSEILALLKALVPICREAGVPLIANDHADLAKKAGCWGVHIGQDMTVEQVRRVDPHLHVGMSTHTTEQLTKALALRPSYVAYGPVFPTVSKHDAAPVVGIDGLKAASLLAKAASIPLVAIGGIREQNVDEIAKYADACALIGGLVPAPHINDHDRLPEVIRRATAYQRAFGG